MRGTGYTQWGGWSVSGVSGLEKGDRPVHAGNFCRIFSGESFYPDKRGVSSITGFRTSNTQAAKTVNSGPYEPDRPTTLTTLAGTSRSDRRNAVVKRERHPRVRSEPRFQDSDGLGVVLGVPEGCFWGFYKELWNVRWIY